ncbi:MAG: DUF438 domain-containing protein [Nitrospirae bacterium]|nr:DUF438 domain-containing protein [Nitrospirota bacterium]
MATDRLVVIIERLRAGEDPANLKEAAQELLTSIPREELSFAGQKLVEAGLAPEDLKHLCSLHMGMHDDETGRIKAGLAPGHVIHTLVSEHEMILHFLDELEKLNQAAQKMAGYSTNKDEVKKVMHIAEHLIGAEPHHQREEEVLFPEVEKRGVSGPPQVMRMEHEDLRRRKHELMEISETSDKLDFNTFRKRLDATARFIVLTLRDHIFKENNILYPMALQVIQDRDSWDKMKSECDKIGYCCFTPEV